MSRPPVEVRRACIDDLDDLLHLWSTSREELGRGVRAVAGPPPDQLRPRLRESLTVADAPILIARHEGAPAGYALLRLAPVLAVDGTALHIDHLYVVPALRRRGVARALLVAATSVAERNGADQVLAGAPPSARDAHRFLARLGFSPLVVRRVVGTAHLRRRLSGEGQRRGLDDLLSRRRSLRARAARAAWTPSWGGVETPVAAQAPSGLQVTSALQPTALQGTSALQPTALQPTALQGPLTLTVPVAIASPTMIDLPASERILIADCAVRRLDLAPAEQAAPGEQAEPGRPVDLAEAGAAGDGDAGAGEPSPATETVPGQGRRRRQRA